LIDPACFALAALLSMTDASHSVSSGRKVRPSPPADMHDAICRRAEEIYIRNGRIPGHDLENWMQADSSATQCPRSVMNS
jgi:hypothetical protein